MRFIFQCPQNLINEALVLLAVFFAFACAAVVMLKPRFNVWIIFASVFVLWELCTLDLRFTEGCAELRYAEFFFVVPWVMICFRDSILNRLICSALFMFVRFIAEVITELVFAEFFGVRHRFEQPYACIAFIAVAYVILSLITLIWIKLFKKKTSADAFSNIFTFITVVLAEIIITAVNGVMIFAVDSAAGFNVILSLMLGFLFLDIMAFVYIRSTARIQRLNAENEILSAENRIQADYYTKIRESVDSTAKIRHDINNIINVIQILLKTKDGDDLQKASELLNDLKQTAEASVIPSVCNNRLVNLILYDKLRTANALGIRIMDNIILGDDCGIDDFDICRIFVNLIDNGINALSKCQSDDTELYISCRESDGVLYIKTVNAYNSAVKKESRRGHGYGLKIISDICEKYEGSITTENNGNKFTVLIVLKTITE